MALQIFLLRVFSAYPAGSARENVFQPLSFESAAAGTFPEMTNYRLALAARRLRTRRLIISTPAEKAREK
jgi:hypothetical protein